jgi:cytoskeletal protein CcmA (bactofilin family)
MIKINGKVFNASNISIFNKQIMINGQIIDSDEDTFNHDIKIEIADGSKIEKFEIHTCNKCYVTGDVEKVQSSSGDIKVTGEVKGNVTSSSGDVSVGGNVLGNVQTSSGDIRFKK